MINAKINRSLVLIVVLTLGVSACGTSNSTSVVRPPTAKTPASPISISPNLEKITSENIDTLEQINKLGAGRVYGYDLSPDKSKIAIYIHDKIKILKTDTLEEELTINTRKNVSQKDLKLDTWSIIRFFQDGKALAFTDGSWVTIWDISINQEIGWFPSRIPVWDIVDIGLSHDGQRLALITLGSSGPCDGRDMNIALYDIKGQLLFDQYSCADYSNNYYKFVGNDKVYFSFSSIMTDKFPSKFYLIATQNGNLLETSSYNFATDAPIEQEVLYDVSSDGEVLAYAVYSDKATYTKLIEYSTGKNIKTVDGLIEFAVMDGKTTWQMRVFGFVNPEQELKSRECGFENIHPVDNYKELFVNNNIALLLVSHFGEFSYLDLFNLDTCQTIKRISYPAVGNSAVFSPDGRWLATSDGFNAYVWDVKSGNLHFSIFGIPFVEPKDVIRFNADGTRLIVSSFGRDYYHPYQPYRHYSISVFDVNSGTQTKLIKPESEFLYSIAPSPNKDIILAQDSKGFHFWNIETGEFVSSISSGAYVFNPNSDLIWVAPQDRAVTPSEGNVYVYNYMTGKVVRAFVSIPTLWIRGLYLNSNNTKLMAHLFLGQGKDKGDSISIFDIETGEQIFSYHLPWQDYELAAYGDMFATNGAEGLLHLWNYENDTSIRTFLVGHKNRKIGDNYDDYFDSGNYIDANFYNEDILFTMNNALRFWDVSSGVLLTEVMPDYQVENLIFSPDQSIICAIGKDGIVRLWGVRKKDG